MRNLLAPVVLVAAAVSGVAAWQQSEIDRVLWNFNGAIVTTSDVWQARQLKLVTDADTDDKILRALQNRLLILMEVKRVPPSLPAADDVDSRRREWEATLGPGADVRSLLTKAGMSQKACDTWITDDLRIRAYLRERFGMLPEAERGARTDEWLRGLRQRAGLGK